MTSRRVWKGFQTDPDDKALIYDSRYSRYIWGADVTLRAVHSVVTLFHGTWFELVTSDVGEVEYVLCLYYTSIHSDLLDTSYLNIAV
jgi:hypothetical protein